MKKFYKSIDRVTWYNFISGLSAYQAFADNIILYSTWVTIRRNGLREHGAAYLGHGVNEHVVLVFDAEEDATAFILTFG